MKNLDLSFFLKFRQYNSYSFSYGTVEKTFNRGAGSLSLFRFYENEKLVLVNECLFNKADGKHLQEFMELNNITDWAVKKVPYGYPEYYTKSFGINLLNN